uniref:Uncharacterized protein n=1 Tax=Anguilla anguilla TaxID=7936 RepID=A0A0E9UA09_ANGAN
MHGGLLLGNLVFNHMAMLRGILEDAFRFGILLRPALCSFIRSVVF